VKGVASWLAAAGWLWAVASAGAAEGGWLALQGTNVVSLGQYPNTEDRTAVVTVRNEGNEPLEIARVVLTCKCMRLKSYPHSLMPGESGEVAVTIAKNEVAGPFERIFFIESNGRQNRSIRVRIVGDAKPLFEVTCDRPHALGPVDTGTVWTGRFTVAATEGGIRLGAPSARNQGAACEFSVVTNLHPRLFYEVNMRVVFDGEGLLESTLVFPVIRDDGEQTLPVRLTVEAVRRRPCRVVPDRLMVAPGGADVRRRLLVSIESAEALDASRLSWTIEPENVEVKASTAKSGKAFFVDLTFSAHSLERLDSAKGGWIRMSYGGGQLLEVPIQVSAR